MYVMTYSPFTSPATKNTGKKFYVLDSQKSFVVLAESEEKLEMPINLLELQGHNIQPMLLIMEDFPEINTIFIYFNKKKDIHFLK